MDTETRIMTEEIVARHVNQMLSELSEREGVDLGYYPDDNGGIVACVMGCLHHQRNINDYHAREKTNFSA